MEFSSEAMPNVRQLPKIRRGPAIGVDDAGELIATNPASAPIDRGLYGDSQKSGPTQAQDTNGG
jgi:hypothetical protein